MYVKRHEQFEIGCGAILNKILYYIILYYIILYYIILYYIILYYIILYYIILQVLTIETLHSLGLVTLVFGVLPKVPPLYAVGLLTCVAAVPAFLQIILPRTHQIKTSTVLVKWTVSLLALLVQLGACVYMYIVYMVIEGHKDDPRMKNLYWQVGIIFIGFVVSAIVV